MNDYRSRIYGTYVSARPETLAPLKLCGLKPRAAYLRRMVQRHFPADLSAQVLELGCGHGALIHFARELGYCNVWGVDGSSEQVTAAKRLGINGVHDGDIQKTLSSQAKASLDVVVTFDVIEHFTRNELLPLVDEVYRVLRPGGRWIIHTPNGDSPFFGAVRYGDLTHELAFTCKSLQQLFLSSGFLKVDCYEDSPVVHGAKSAVRWILWKVIRALLRLYKGAETGDISKRHIFSQNLVAVIIR